MMNDLFNIFPFVGETSEKLNKLNKLLNKVTLTGKINALNVASNLFEFTDKTSHTFDELKDTLTDSLLDVNLQKILNELKSKSQITIDILIRNLFERTADIGFLATDNVIVDFLTSNNISKDDMYNHLVEYTKKYSVYNEIVVFDINGDVKVNINNKNIILNSKDLIIREALLSDEYVEVYKKSDIFISQEKTLIYAQRIQQNSKNIGVLCLCFRLEDELNTIFENLFIKNEVIALADKSGVIAISDRLKIENSSLKYVEKEYQVLNSKNLAVYSKCSSYQGYSGISDWYSIAISISSNSILLDDILESKENRPKNINLLNDELMEIIKKADDIVEDLKDVIINGELIASKRKVYVLRPILDNLREISSTLIETIKDSVLNLEKLIEFSLISDVKMASNLAIDIMDRNLYERANDCRWWALTREFQDELLKDIPDESKLTNILKYINNLYTVYTNLYLYNTKGVVVASSNDNSIIGKKITPSILSKVLNNNDTQNYFVNEFQKNEFYNFRATYIYNASVHKKDKSVGGIGIVFDSEVEFKAILEDCFTANKQGFSFFIDNNRKIIASTHHKLSVLDTLDIDDSYLNLKSNITTFDYIKFEGKQYIMSCASSKGYREYKNGDNLYAITFIEI